MNFYAVIIGTEILNGRRVDKHFEFLKNALAKYNHELFASFVIKDDISLMRKVYTLIKNDPKGVMFSFGGIGSTPDDLTREISSEVFRQSPLVVHEKFKQDIIDKFKDQAYPHRIKMANLPPDSQLLFNPINNMSGYSLDERYFFTPGFMQMAHPMVEDAIERFFSQKKEKYRYTLLANTSENTLISMMQKLPKSIELSSLPMFKENKPMVELSLSGFEKSNVYNHFNLFCKELERLNIEYELLKTK